MNSFGANRQKIISKTHNVVEIVCSAQTISLTKQREKSSLSFHAVVLLIRPLSWHLHHLPLKSSFNRDTLKNHKKKPQSAEWHFDTQLDILCRIVWMCISLCAFAQEQNYGMQNPVEFEPNAICNGTTQSQSQLCSRARSGISVFCLNHFISFHFISFNINELCVMCVCLFVSK